MQRMSVECDAEVPLIPMADQITSNRKKDSTAETYFTNNHPEVKLLKFDTYTEAFNALLDGRGDALSTDNTEVQAYINSGIGALASEQFFHADFEATLKDVYGDAVNPDSLVVEGGVITAE